MTPRAVALIVRRHGRAPRAPVPTALYPHMVELEYARALVSQVRLLRARPSRAAWARVAQAMTATVRSIAMRAADHQARQLDRQTRAVLGVPAAALGVTLYSGRFDARRKRGAPPAPPQLEPRVQEWITENVALITDLGDKPLREIEQLVAEGFAAGDRNTTLAEALVEKVGLAEDRARIIARDQIGKLNGRISADRHQRMGLTRFTWRDVGDQRVRPVHRHLSGTTWTYAKPPSEGLPGEPILCRCHDEPIFDDILAELDRLGF